MRRVRWYAPLLAAGLLLVTAGCYHMGSLMHPQIKSIAIAPVVNETNVYNVSAQVRQLLSEQFMRDGSLKVKSMGTADCELFVRVVGVLFAEVEDSDYRTTHDRRVYTPKEWEAVVKAEYSVIIPGRREPLVRGTASGRALFQVQADMDINRANGIRQAARELALDIVSKTVEAW